MKKRSLEIAQIVIYCFLINSINAQKLILLPSHESGVYAKGEKIEFSIFITNAFKDSVNISIRKNFQHPYEQKRVYFSGDTLKLIVDSPMEPASIILNATTHNDTVTMGCIIDPDKLTPSSSRPKDLDRFWNDEKKALRNLTMMFQTVNVPIPDSGYICHDVEINCLGPRPARGYLVKPKNAKLHSLPIVLFLHGAGVSGFWCRSEPGNALKYARMGHGALSFDLNAHGMLNGQPDAYYKELENGELKNYALQGVENKETVYFRGMYLRLIRTLDYLTSQPEWDGKRILVIGESQGGGQALAAAGLYPQVSAVVATVPAMCDWARVIVGSKGTWPYPFESKNDKEKMLLSLPYYDVAHLLVNAKATIVTEIGLIDFTCPSEAIYAAINQSKTNKVIYPVPYRAHNLAQGRFKEIWNKTVTFPKENFINNYLK